MLFSLTLSTSRWCRYASRAHYYNGGCGSVLLCLVAVGNTETVMRRDCSRGAPSSGFDSIVVPGRRLPSQAVGRGECGANPAGHARFNEEYVVFDGSQVLPLCLLEYTVRRPADQHL